MFCTLRVTQQLSYPILDGRCLQQQQVPGHYLVHLMHAGEGLFNQHYKLFASLTGAVVSNASFVFHPTFRT